MLTNNSLKEYYVKLQSLYNDAVNMLTAINQSLSSSASQVTVVLNDNTENRQVLRIPTFMYLENKLEQLNTNFDNLFEMPKSGEAWFENNNNMYKLKMVRAKSAPQQPVLGNLDKVYASITDNNVLKDLVSPKTYLKIDITNLTDNITNLFMRKLVIHDVDVYNEILARVGTGKEYKDYFEILSELRQGSDYDIYDSVIPLPVKEDPYDSSFNIVSLVNDGFSDNPRIDSISKNLLYDITVNTLEYTNNETGQKSMLSANDYLCLGDEMVIYRVNEIVDINTNEIIIEEITGHQALQTFDENSDMILHIYNENYSKFHYAQVPLEENPYICIFLGTIYNGVRSILSNGYLVNLYSIKMVDANGQPIKNKFNVQYNYIDYYHDYCTNIGDLILGLTQSAYPQVSNYTPNELNIIQDSQVVQRYVTNTIDNTQILTVVPINRHLIDDTTTEEIISLHAQKSEISAKISTINENINNTYNQLISTDFSQELNITQNSLQSQLKQYYTEKIELQRQFNALVDNINVKSVDNVLGTDNVKYRVRGVTVTDEFEQYIHNTINSTCDIIGLEVEYKYKSVTKDTTSLTEINSNTFTNWNRQTNIDKQRYLKFDNNIESFILEYEDYNTNDNKIKWNQIDIPIKQGEDVVIRIRYKYNVGQPFVNIYSPWSDELTVVFPAEYSDSVELSNIIAANVVDTDSARFNKVLIDDGYEEHVANKIIDDRQVFYHMPDNIYSGFNTAENNLISLKDKLYEMSNEIDRYKEMIDREVNSEITIYANYNGQTIELHPNIVNTINIYDNKMLEGKFSKKDINIVVKNTGSAYVRLYSIFPTRQNGLSNIPLIATNEYYWEDIITNYESVPLIANNKVTPQMTNQWIYFRENNPFTHASMYYVSDQQDTKDLNSITKIVSSDPSTSTGILDFVSDFPGIYMKNNNNQARLAKRLRKISDNPIYNNSEMYWNGFSINDTYQVLYDNLLPEKYNYNDLNIMYDKYVTSSYPFFYIDPNSVGNKENRWLMRYEDIVAYNEKNDTYIHLDSNSPISAFIDKLNADYSVSGFSTVEQGISESMFTGAFLFPELNDINNIMIDSKMTYRPLGVGQSLTVPLTFEYYLSNNDNSNETPITNIKKTICFDIRDSLAKDPLHYIIEVIGNYDINASSMVYSDGDTLSFIGEDN